MELVALTLWQDNIEAAVFLFQELAAIYCPCWPGCLLMYSICLWSYAMRNCTRPFDSQNNSALCNFNISLKRNHDVEACVPCVPTSAFNKINYFGWVLGWTQRWRHDMTVVIFVLNSVLLYVRFHWNVWSTIGFYAIVPGHNCLPVVREINFSTMSGCKFQLSHTNHLQRIWNAVR